MSDDPEIASLTRWLADLQRQVRDLATGNPLNKGTVQDASGASVPMSNLAFGQVTDLWEGVGVIQPQGVAGQTVGGSSNPASWTYPGKPSVEVLVRGGRLRVDWAGLLALLGGNADAGAAWMFGYAVDYIGPPDGRGAVNQRVIDPNYYRSIICRDTALTGFYVECGNWFMHTGLAAGWYRVSGAFLLTYNASTGTQPWGFADNPRIAATPF